MPLERDWNFPENAVYDTGQRTPEGDPIFEPIVVPDDQKKGWRFRRWSHKERKDFVEKYGDPTTLEFPKPGVSTLEVRKKALQTWVVKGPLNLKEEEDYEKLDPIIGDEMFTNLMGFMTPRLQRRDIQKKS